MAWAWVWGGALTSLLPPLPGPEPLTECQSHCRQNLITLGINEDC